MREEVAIRVIKEIENNPRIHYVDLAKKTKAYIQDNELYTLLYGLREVKIIATTETEKYPKKLSMIRSIERSEFELADKNDLLEKLKKVFCTWKL